MSYDLFMLAILGCCIVLGGIKGVAWQLASICSLVFSFLVARKFTPAVAPLISAAEPWNKAIAMLILFVATGAAVWLAFRAIRTAIEKAKLKSYDRQLGAIFGGIKGAVICVAVTFFAVTLSESARQSVLASQSGYYISVLLEKGHEFLPEGIDERIHKHYDEFQAKLSPTGEVPKRKPQHANSDDLQLPIDGSPINAGDLSRRIDDFFKSSDGQIR